LGCLPYSIVHLSQLKTVRLQGCDKLEMNDELKIHYLIILIFSSQFASFYVCVIFLFLFYLNVYYVQRWV
jgi:hypothetical protein